MTELRFPKTRITELFGIKYPLIQGGMAAGFVSTAELVAAVGNAGGIGFMSCIQWSTDVSKLEDEIKKAKDLTDKPFGVNFTIFPEQFSDEYYRKVFDIIVRQEVKAVESSARKPDPWMRLFKEAGIKAIHKVARIKDGIAAAKLGADAICIIGSEEGGHPGAERNPTIVVGPLMVDSVPVPVSIGGGFCDGRGLVAALALGADAITMGTRWVTSKECIVHQKYKEAIVNMNYNETDYILMSIGDPVRAIRSDMTQAILRVEFKEDKTELMGLLMGMLKQHDEGKMAVNTGDIKNGVAPAGVVGGRINEIKTCQQIVDDIMAEAEVVLKMLSERKLWYQVKK